jgi:hypothetical protein
MVCFQIIEYNGSLCVTGKEQIKNSTLIRFGLNVQHGFMRL